MEKTEFAILNRFRDFNQAAGESEEQFQLRINNFLKNKDVLNVQVYWADWKVFVWYKYSMD